MYHAMAHCRAGNVQSLCRNIVIYHSEPNDSFAHLQNSTLSLGAPTQNQILFSLNVDDKVENQLAIDKDNETRSFH